MRLQPGPLPELRHGGRYRLRRRTEGQVTVRCETVII